MPRSVRHSTSSGVFQDWESRSANSADKYCRAGKFLRNQNGRKGGQNQRKHGVVPYPDLEQQDKPVDAGKSAVDRKHLLRRFTQRLQSHRHMATVLGASQRERRIDIEIQFIPYTRHDSGRKISVGAADHLECIVTRERMSQIEKFDGREIDHKADFRERNEPLSVNSGSSRDCGQTRRSDC